MITNPDMMVDTNNVNTLLASDIILKDAATEKDRDIFINFQCNEERKRFSRTLQSANVR